MGFPLEHWTWILKCSARIARRAAFDANARAKHAEAFARRASADAEAIAADAHATAERHAAVRDALRDQRQTLDALGDRLRAVCVDPEREEQ